MDFNLRQRPHTRQIKTCGVNWQAARFHLRTTWGKPQFH